MNTGIYQYAFVDDYDPDTRPDSVKVYPLFVPALQIKLKSHDFIDINQHPVFFFSFLPLF